MKHRYDLKPSKPKLKYMPNMIYKAPQDLKIPESVDMRSLCSPVENQGQLGSCTSFAMIGMLEFLELKDFRSKQTMQPEEYAGQGLQVMSHLALYYAERVIQNTVQEDSGASVSDSVQAMLQYGVCNENLWPYDINNFAITPSPVAYYQGLRHRISQYQQIVSQDDALGCLAAGYPFIIGIQVYESFESAQADATGIIPMPQPGEQYLGGHCVCIVGYNQAEQMFIFRNSWATIWGAEGYGYLPFEYVADNQLASDFWTVQK